MMDRDQRHEFRATSRYFADGDYAPHISLRGVRMNPETGHRIEVITDNRAHTMWTVCRGCNYVVPVGSRDDQLWQVAVMN